MPRCVGYILEFLLLLSLMLPAQIMSLSHLFGITIIFFIKILALILLPSLIHITHTHAHTHTLSHTVGGVGREKEKSPIYSSLPKLQPLGMDKAEFRSQELHLSRESGIQGCGDLYHFTTFSGTLAASWIRSTTARNLTIVA